MKVGNANSMIKNNPSFNSVKKKKVLMTLPFPPPFAGPEIVSLALMKELVKYKDIVFLFSNSNFRKKVLEKGKINLKGIFPFILTYIRYLSNIILFQPDVIYLVIGISKVSFYKDIVFIKTARIFGKKLILHMRGGNYKNFYDISPIKLQNQIDGLWGKASGFIVQSENLVSLIPTKLKNIKTVVIPNGLDSNSFGERKINRGKATIRIFFIGYLSFTKGFYDLIKVYPILKEKYKYIELVYAGEYPQISPQLGNFLKGELKEFYFNNIEKINAEIIEFINKNESYDAKYLGVINNQEAIENYLASDIFVLPSYMEGFSVALLEAMFAGLPIVATKVGAAEDVIKDGFNGFLTEPGDNINLGKNLELLIRNKELRLEIGERNYNESRSKYSVAKIAKQYIDLYSSI